MIQDRLRVYPLLLFLIDIMIKNLKMGIILVIIYLVAELS